MFRRILCWSLIAGVVSIALPSPAYGAGELKAGAAKVVITPKTDMWLSGYASRREPSDGKIHDLFAKALAFEDETGARSVIVTTDLLGLTASISRRIAQLVQETHGIPRERLLLTSSHTHCGPVLRDNLPAAYGLEEAETLKIQEYTEKLPGLIFMAIEQSIEPGDDTDPRILDIAASFQAAVIDMLAATTERALVKFASKGIVLCGGVAANRGLRARFAELAQRQRMPLFVSPPPLATDNGAMIAGAVLRRISMGESDPLALAARATWPLGC